MTGKIVHLNHNRGMYSVELTNGSYTVFELLDTNEIEQGNAIAGSLDELGSCELQNLTADENFDAIVQNIGLSKKMAYNRTFLL